MPRLTRGFRRKVFLAIADDLVFHVRDIHAVPHLVARGLEGALQEILEQEGSQVPDVGKVVDRWAAGIEGDDPRRDGRYGFHLAGEGVEESEVGQCAHPNS